MLVLRRKDGQWLTITHKSGDVMRVRVYNFRENRQCDLGFDDAAHNFAIQRPEREAKAEKKLPGRLVFDHTRGCVVVNGTLVAAAHVVDLILNGSTWDEVIGFHPELTKDDVRACLAWHVADPGGANGCRGPNIDCALPD